jgi:sec-independent protein translocase protein TatB
LLRGVAPAEYRKPVAFRAGFLADRTRKRLSVRADACSGPYTRGVFNLGPGEMIVILVAGLVVLGPEKLPDMIRKAGRLYGELRRMANGFQSEFRDVFEDPMNDFKDTAAQARRMFDEPLALVKDTAASARSMFEDPGESAAAVSSPDEQAPFKSVIISGGGDPEPEAGTDVSDTAATGWEGAATTFDAGTVPYVPIAEGATAEIQTWGAPAPDEKLGDTLPPPVIHLRVTE